MKSQRFISIIVVAISLGVSALACGSSQGDGGGSNGGSERDITGSYTVSGVNLEGRRYQGEAKITRSSGGGYMVNWLIGSSTQTGSGALDGDTLTVTWSDGTYGGVATYKLQSDGSLDGTWNQDGQSGEGTETLTPENRSSS